MSDRRNWPIVVGGCYRSGTSLVRRILDTHSRIHCGPEIKFFRDFWGDYPGDAFAHLRFATTIRDLVPEEEALKVLGRAFVELHELAARRAGKERWADKVPENVLYTDSWQQLLDERWLLVHVARNPLDTVASMQGRFPLALPEDVAGQADLYRRYVQAGLDFGERHPDRCFLVVYEQLCTTPQETIGSLMQWLGEDFEIGQLDFNDVQHQEGLEDPQIGSTSGIHGQGLGRWRSVLTEEEAALVWARTGAAWRVIDPLERYEMPDRVVGNPSSPGTI